MPNIKLILSELESSINFQYVIPPITTVSYFKGNLEQIAPQIKERWRLILEANPWLTGRIIKNKDHKRLQLEYSNDTPIPKETMDKHFVLNPVGLELHS